MAVEWEKAAAEEAFVGRTASRGEDLGSQLVAGRIVERLMRLAFLQRRTYFPQAKWFGTAFQGLPDLGDLALVLHRVVRARNPEARQTALGRAYQLVGAFHNGLGFGPSVDLTLSPYYARPFPVIFAGRFAQALDLQIKKPLLKARGRLGSLDQITDHLPLLEHPGLARERMILLPSGARRMV
jgi:hypothetical protein